MMYIPYSLETLKHHAKKLKRIAKSQGRTLSSMDCLNAVAMLHNADDWNHLYKTHNRKISALADDLESHLRDNSVRFIEDLTWEHRAKCLFMITERLDEAGWHEDAIEAYTNVVLSFYTPMYSDFYREVVNAFGGEGGEDGEEPLPHYTSLNDMFGNLFVVGRSPEKHTDYLKEAVLPACAKQGGLLVLSASQYEKTKKALQKEGARVLVANQVDFLDQCRWSEKVDIETLRRFFDAGIYGLDSGSMLEGRAASYIDCFFALWERVGLHTVPVTDIHDFSPRTLARLLQKVSRNDEVGVRVRDTLQRHFDIECHHEDWAEHLTERENELFGLLTILHDALANINRNRSGLALDTLFDDLSVTTVLVCSDNPTISEIRGPLEKAKACGILSILRARLLSARRDAILHKTKRSRFLVYTAPFTHAVCRGYTELTSGLGDGIKVVTSALVDPRGATSERIRPSALPSFDSTSLAIDSMEYNALCHQASHIIDLNKLSLGK